MSLPDVSLRAAQYVRMSTERQDLSLDFQMATNAAYAMERGLTIVRTYTDAGISGLTLNKRDGLRALLADVVGGRADYATVLVYDVSRWGRFQNPDQAAHYEFICSEAGVHIAYCAEPFDNDGSPTSALIKHLKRAMAAEYSRDLSAKISRAQRILLADGYWAGGRIPLGYRPILIRRDGTPVISPRDDCWRKQQGVRTKLTLGPDSEVELVRRIFRLYLRKNGTFTTVSRRLDRDPALIESLGAWSPKRVADTLRNEVYVGRLIGGRRIKAVGETWGSPAPRDQWIVAEGAVPAIVSEQTFNAARKKRLKRAGPILRSDALLDLQRIAAEYGDVSQRMIRIHGQWSVGVYTRIFGSITAIRELMQIPIPEKYAHLAAAIQASNRARREACLTYTDEQLRDALRTALHRYGRLSEQTLNAMGTPNTCTFRRRFGSMEAAYKQVGYEPTEAQKLAMRSAHKRVAKTFR
jgi:DNA invertase Pin-like site-specific DNA recombinase